ncbi:MAG: Do family serine endopeptidase [Sphingomonadaceae bacterium]|nr:Do family serine endopeptidase [Sphingomonadaceae bacterium]
MRIAFAITGAAILFASAATLALQEPGHAQLAAQEPLSAQPQAAAPGGAPGSFADLTARLQPAVVNVSTTQEIEVGRLRGIPRFAPGTPLDELFRRFQEQQQDGQEPETREAQSLGSGFIISPDGYVVTNNHVVTGRGGAEPVDKITVTLSDRTEYSARIVGRDPLSDLALLKIEGKDLPYVRFGQSERVRVGDWVIAIGNPFGLGGTVTAGIVSALHRNIQAGQYDRYIQTDASINQGNSGGPMFDLNGNVIGVNTAIFSPTGGNVGIGFAIPAEQASPVIEQLRSIGRVRRGYLGVSIQPVTPEIASALGLQKDRGEIVASVENDGPAKKAGILAGDVITRVNGQEVTVDNTLSSIVANSGIGSRVPIELYRGGKRQTVQATLIERPSEIAVAGNDNAPAAGDKAANDAAASARRSLGITLAELTPEVRRQLGVDNDVEGVVIASLNRNSDAAKRGLQRGDVILSINQQPTKTPAAAAAAVDAARKAGRDTVVLFVKRGSRPPQFIGIAMMGKDEG